MSTQIQPTPIVTSEAAEKIKEQLKIKPSEQIERGMKILKKMFENESYSDKVAICQMSDKLCKDNIICCDDNCQRCANLIYNKYVELQAENSKLKKSNRNWRRKVQRLKVKLDRN